MRVSIHQPNFMPWYPFFQKVMESDVFIILQNCQWEKNGFQNRFKNENGWNTMPVLKGLQPIVDKKYLNPYESWEAIKTKNKKYKSILSLFDGCIQESLAKTNVEIIIKLCDMLRISTPIVLDEPTGLTSTERLVHLCKQHGATSYLAGSSGKKYLDMSLFEKEGIAVEFQQDSTMIKKPILEML
jgi:hypothetical protein